MFRKYRSIIPISLACVLAIALMTTSIVMAGQPPHVARTGSPDHVPDHAPPAAEAVYEVVSPLAPPSIEMIEMVPRLDTLGGKRIGVTAMECFKGAIWAPVLAELLAEAYPTAEIVPYTDFPFLTGTELSSDAGRNSVLEKIVEYELDAVIMGTGG